jgi:hypothetical protein
MSGRRRPSFLSEYGVGAALFAVSLGLTLVVGWVLVHS